MEIGTEVFTEGDSKGMKQGDTQREKQEFTEWDTFRGSHWQREAKHSQNKAQRETLREGSTNRGKH